METSLRRFRDIDTDKFSKSHSAGGLLVSFLLLLLTLLGTARADTIPLLQFIEPAYGQSIHGIQRFVLATLNSKLIKTVRLNLGSKRLGIARASPFAISWNTGYASEGSYAI